MAIGHDDPTVFPVADAGYLRQILVPVGAAVLQKHVRQLADDIFAFALDDHIEVAVVEGFLGHGTHLRAAADGYDLRMELFGQTGNLVTTGRFVDQRRDHEDVHAFEVFVWVHEAGAVFEPDLPLVDVRSFPLGESA